MGIRTLVTLAAVLTLLALTRLGPSRPLFAADEVAVVHPLVAAARDQVGKTLIYDASYQSLDYPNGDVPMDRGVCTDVVIRAFRTALGQDLQKLVHDDMVAHFDRYPKEWGLRKPDPSIDHRRVQNLQTYFQRMGYALAPPKKATPADVAASDFRAGDLVTCTVPPNQAHIMVVSDRVTSVGLPLVIHNIGQGAREENRLLQFPLTGHYRIATAKPTPAPPTDKDERR